MGVETIQIEVPSELARRLRSYRNELPHILEWGLRYVEGETEVQVEAVPDAVEMQRRVVAALHQAGAVGPTPEEVAQYLSVSKNWDWKPIVAGGKPASEMIIGDRNSRPWAK